MINTKIYIGANNSTGIVELDTIIYLLAKEGIEGYTIINTIGIWQGKKENSVIIDILEDIPKDWHKITDILKTELEQKLHNGRTSRIKNLRILLNI